MKNKPTPVDELTIPSNVNPELFAQGYWHGMKSNKLIDFRHSFREGFRKAQLEKRKNNNGQSKFKITTTY